MTALLELRKLSKRFGSISALSDVSLRVYGGQVHAIMGENGAGKSTLIKALSGIHTPSAGEILLDGRAVELDSPLKAAELGIRTVHQELHIVPQMTVAENIMLGATPTRGGLIAQRSLYRTAREILSQLGADIEPGELAGRLSRSQQQLIEICRALLGDARLLIMDEPTASLGEEESRQLLDIVWRVTADGVGVIYVSHRMHEVVEIADEVTILRDGNYVSTHHTPISQGQLVEDMIGRPVSELYTHRRRDPGETLLHVSGLSTSLLSDVNVRVRAGEIVGLAGLIGSGKSEIARAIYGLENLSSGSVFVEGREQSKLRPARMLRAGVAYYPSDRRREGLILRRPLRESITLGALRAGGLTRGGLIRVSKEKRSADELAARLSLRPPTVAAPASQYSGGNQQKGLIARGMLHRATVHIFDEPTVGIDIGAKADVYAQMDEYAAAGAGIIVVSSDLTELIGISDRVYVVSDGRIRAELVGDEITESAVASHFFTTN